VRQDFGHLSKLAENGPRSNAAVTQLVNVAPTPKYQSRQSKET
jgi:hypothetical protein